MAEAKKVTTGDRCPIDGGEFVVDDAQDPDKVIDRHTRNAHSPAVAARFAEQVREKVKEFGVIHKCVTCGYRSRFPPVDAREDGDALGRDGAPGATRGDEAGGQGGNGGAGSGGKGRGRGTSHAAA